MGGDWHHMATRRRYSVGVVEFTDTDCSTPLGHGWGITRGTYCRRRRVWCSLWRVLKYHSATDAGASAASRSWLEIGVGVRIVGGRLAKWIT